MGRTEVSREAFPNHTGGVLHVQYRTRYGVVPEALLEDDRLDLDSRAVAAWLAVKPPGWQIKVTALRRRLARKSESVPGREPMLGKDRWQRIASELEAAGYLFRQKSNGPGGQWSWNIIFNPVPTATAGFPVHGSDAVAGFPADGQATHGTAAVGSAVAGDHGHKVLPTGEIPLQTTTTARAVAVDAQLQKERGGGDLYNNLVFEPTIAAMKAQLTAVLVKQKVPDPVLCQDLLDELAGVLEAGKRGERQALKLPSAWFQRLAIKAIQGDFERMHCRAIQRRRLSAPTAQQKPSDAQRPFGPSAAGMQTLTELKTILRSRST